MTVEISRADVVDTHILEDLPNAFIKLPIGRYLESIDVVPLPSQMAIINAINKYRFVVAAISRRQGKTYISNIIGQCIALVPGCNILIMSPNYSLSQISFELQRKLLKHHGIKPEKDNAKDKVIELENGSTIRMGSVNQVDSCVGRSYDLIIFDEAALADGMDAFNVALRPTLDKPNSKAIFISTPRGKTNWFAKLYNRGYDIDENGAEAKFSEWCSIKATYKDNPRMSEADVEEAMRVMSKNEFNQEYMADFNSYEGQIWNLQEEDIVEDIIIVEDGVERQDDGKVYLERHKLDIVAGLDLGFRDPTAMVVCGYNYEEEVFYILDEYWNHDRETATSKHAAAIQKLIDKWDIDFIFIDSAAQQTRFDFARDYDIPTINANKKSVTDGLGYVSSLVDNHKIKVPKKCREVLAAFDGYRWDENVNLVKEKPMHNRASHMADAIRYAIYSFENSVGTL